MSLPIEPEIKAVLGWFGGKVGSAAANVALAPINALASGIADAVGQLLATLGTLWIRLNVPNVWTGDTTSGVVQMLHSEVAPLAGLLAVLGIIIGAARLAWQQTAQTGVELLEGLFIMVVVTGMGVPMIATLVSGADAWSESIIENGTAGTDFGRNITAMLSLGGPTLAPVLAIFFGILALLVSITQIGLLVFRAAALVLLAGRSSRYRRCCASLSRRPRRCTPGRRRPRRGQRPCRCRPAPAGPSPSPTRRQWR
jgi:type IV secretion system protein TrbL